MRPPSVVIVETLLVLCAAAQTRAQIDSACLARAASRLRPDQRLTVTAPDGRTIYGRLVAIDFSTPGLNLYRIDSTGLSTFTVNSREIATLRYRKPFKPSFIFGAVGFFAGAAIGAAVEAKIIQSGSSYDLWPFDVPDTNNYGGWFGGIAGFFIGVFGPGVAFPTGTVRCK